MGSKVEMSPQLEGQIGEFSENEFLPQVVAQSGEQNLQQVAAKIMSDIFSVPWGHLVRSDLQSERIEYQHL